MNKSNDSYVASLFQKQILEQDTIQYLLQDTSKLELGISEKINAASNYQINDLDDFNALISILNNTDNAIKIHLQSLKIISEKIDDAFNLTKRIDSLINTPTVEKISNITTSNLKSDKLMINSIQCILSSNSTKENA